MQMLDRGASGTRHHRWGSEILATMLAHRELNASMTPAQKDALQAESEKLTGHVERLAAANAPYRQFIETAYVGIRAQQRVGNYLCDVPLTDAVGRVRGQRKDAEEAVPGILAKMTAGVSLSRALDAGHTRTVEIVRIAADALSLLPARFTFAPECAAALTVAAERLDGLNKKRKEQLDPQRAPLKVAVERAILELRECLDQMNGRLRTHFPASFIDSLYPELDAKGRAIASDQDEDDDDTVTPA